MLDKNYKLRYSSTSSKSLIALIFRVKKKGGPLENRRFTVGGRTYELAEFLKPGEVWVTGHVMVERARELSAMLGEEDGWHIAESWREMPEALSQIKMAFPKWPHPTDPARIACVKVVLIYRWVRVYRWLDDPWGGEDRLVRYLP